ncbi:AAA domain-containing protein [Ditylenchus destructor]|nr:AAA domain-containing protein [Ditylenchus destructor]
MLKAAAPSRVNKRPLQDSDACNREPPQKKPSDSGDVRNAHLQLNSQDNNGGAQIGSQNVIRKADTKVQSIELTNFMCHSSLKLEFDTAKHNCFYIVGANGSGKSAIFAALNIGLGGKGRANDRGSSLQAYIKEGQDSARIRIVLDNCGAPYPNFGDQIIVERSITRTASTFVLKTRNTPGDSEKNLLQINGVAFDRGIYIVKEYEDLIKRFKAGQKIEETKIYLCQLKWKALWSKVKDVDQEIASEDRNIAKIAEAKCRIQKNITNNEEKIKAAESEKTAVSSRVEELQKEFHTRKAEHRDKGAELSARDRAVRDTKDEIGKIVANMKLVEKELKLAEIQLRKVQGNANRDLNVEKEQLQSEKIAAQQKLNKLKEQKEQLMQTLKECDEEFSNKAKSTP